MTEIYSPGVDSDNCRHEWKLLDSTSYADQVRYCYVNKKVFTCNKCGRLIERETY
jgi:hypothetical protein